MIYTITLNPAVDIYDTIAQPLQEIEVNRAETQIIKAAGKGINCSVLLDTLLIPSTAVALLGGFSGAYIKEQLGQKSMIHLKSIPLKAANRINMKLLLKDTSYSINASGPHIDADTKIQLFKEMQSITHNDIVIVSGSLIPGFTQADFITLCQLVKHKQAFLAVDTEILSIPLLKEIQPDLIKPNLYELSLLLKRELHKHTLKQDIEELLQFSGAVLLSLGADGAIYCDRNTILRLTQCEIEAVNTVGCGDALLGGFIGAYEKTHSPSVALQTGGACALAHAENHDHSKAKIEAYFDKLTVTQTALSCATSSCNI